MDICKGEKICELDRVDFCIDSDYDSKVWGLSDKRR